MDTDMVHGSPQDTVTITPTVTSSATHCFLGAADCTFTSDHPEIATVDNSGKITFVSQGKATITATTVDGGYTATVIAYTTYDFSALQQAIADAVRWITRIMLTITVWRLRPLTIRPWRSMRTMSPHRMPLTLPPLH